MKHSIDKWICSSRMFSINLYTIARYWKYQWQVIYQDRARNRLNESADIFLQLRVSDQQSHLWRYFWDKNLFGIYSKDYNNLFTFPTQFVFVQKEINWTRQVSLKRVSQSLQWIPRETNFILFLNKVNFLTGNMATASFLKFK